jgi:hypothetical protein
MKRFLLLMVLAASVQLATAQDFKKLQISVTLKKFEDAKVEIDKLAADPKAQAKAETYYWKGSVYAELAKDNAVKYPNAYKEAVDAFKKYAEMDPTFAIAKTNGPDGYFALYSAAYSTGIKAFEAKKWEESAAGFEAAIAYINTIITNKWTNANIAFDTTSVLYAGHAWYNAKQFDNAAKYYSILANAKVGGEAYMDIYRFLLTHNTEKKNEEQFKKILATGKELYPKETFWDTYQMEYIDNSMTLEEKTAYYEKNDAANALVEGDYEFFGDVFIRAKNSDKLDSAKRASYAGKAADAFKKAYGKNPKNAIAAFNVGVIYYNEFSTYDDQYAANIRAMQALNADRPVEKDPKKKAAADAALKAKTDPIKETNTRIEKTLMESLDVSIDWLEKSYAILKEKATRTSTEKSVINKSVDFLANLYAYKRDKLRGKDNAGFDKYDAKYKEFDALHSKF